MHIFLFIFQPEYGVLSKTELHYYKCLFLPKCKC